MIRSISCFLFLFFSFSSAFAGETITVTVSGYGATEQAAEKSAIPFDLKDVKRIKKIELGFG